MLFAKACGPMPGYRLDPRHSDSVASQGTQLFIRSFELGVLFLPSLEAQYRKHPHRDFSCTPELAKPANVRPVGSAETGIALCCTAFKRRALCNCRLTCTPCLSHRMRMPPDHDVSSPTDSRVKDQLRRFWCQPETILCEAGLGCIGVLTTTAFQN